MKWRQLAAMVKLGNLLTCVNAKKLLVTASNAFAVATYYSYNMTNLTLLYNLLYMLCIPTKLSQAKLLCLAKCLTFLLVAKAGCAALPASAASNTCVPTSLVFTTAAPASSAASNIATQTAGTATKIYITAYGLNANGTCGPLTTYAGSKTIQFWQTYVTPSTGSISATTNNVKVSGNPANPTLVNLIFSNGVSSFTAAYADAGIIALSALDKSNNITGNSGYIKTIPDHFTASINTPSFNTGCNKGGFTYLNQAITYNVAPIITVTAKSAQNATTPNYQGAFWRLAANNIKATYSSNSTTATFNSIAAQTAITVTSKGNGVGTITLGDGGGLRFNKINGTDIKNFTAQISISVTIVDSDGVMNKPNPLLIGSIIGSNGIAFTGGKEMRQGRIALGNNFGSELLPLVIPVTVQYFNGTDYITNTNDSCTSITNPAYVSLSPSPSTLSTSATWSNFASGTASISLKAPQITGNTDVKIILSNLGANMPYLQHNWPQGSNSGTFIDDPVAKANFGIYHGSDKIIYTQEMLN